MTSPAKPPSAPRSDQHPLLVTLAEVSSLLNRSLPSLYRDRAAGRFGPREMRIGGCVYVSTKELREWVDAGCPPS